VGTGQFPPGHRQNGWRLPAGCQGVPVSRRRGAHNGSLFYNLGVALLNAEMYDAAIDAFERAERYDGHSRDTYLSLQIARAKKARVKRMPEPWQRTILFWHYGLATPVRFAISAIAFSLLWIALTLRLLGLRRMARPLIVTSLAVFVLFGSSAMMSVLQESAAPRPSFAIPPPGCSARKVTASVGEMRTG